MRFETQRQLLEYLGKNVNDRSLIQRMMVRGDIVKDNGMYVLVENKGNLWEEVLELREKVWKLEETVLGLENDKKDLEGKVYNLTMEWNTSSELAEAKIQREYYEKKAKKYKEAINKVIHVTYSVIKPKLWNKLEDEATFRDWILGQVSELLQDDD